MKMLDHPNIEWKLNYYALEHLIIEYANREAFFDKENIRNYFCSIENFLLAFVEYKLFNNYFDFFSSYDNLNSCNVDSIIKIISCIEFELLKLEYNVNLKLWLDNFFAILLIGG